MDGIQKIIDACRQHPGDTYHACRGCPFMKKVGNIDYICMFADIPSDWNENEIKEVINGTSDN